MLSRKQRDTLAGQAAAACSVIREIHQELLADDSEPTGEEAREALRAAREAGAAANRLLRRISYLPDAEAPPA